MKVKENKAKRYKNNPNSTHVQDKYKLRTHSSKPLVRELKIN